MSYPIHNQDDGGEVAHTSLFVLLDGLVIGFLLIMGFKPVVHVREIQRSPHGLGVGWSGSTVRGPPPARWQCLRAPQFPSRALKMQWEPAMSGLSSLCSLPILAVLNPAPQSIQPVSPKMDQPGDTEARGEILERFRLEQSSQTEHQR